jgi:hypothetical protein
MPPAPPFLAWRNARGHRCAAVAPDAVCKQVTACAWHLQHCSADQQPHLAPCRGLQMHCHCTWRGLQAINCKNLAPPTLQLGSAFSLPGAMPMRRCIWWRGLPARSATGPTTRTLAERTTASTSHPAGRHVKVHRCASIAPGEGCKKVTAWAWHPQHCSVDQPPLLAPCSSLQMHHSLWHALQAIKCTGLAPPRLQRGSANPPATLWMQGSADAPLHLVVRSACKLLV